MLAVVRRNRVIMEKVKSAMEWTAQNEQMSAERRADQCYGMLMGAEFALDIGREDATEEEENFFNELTEYWEDLRARIYGY